MTEIPAVINKVKKKDSLIETDVGKAYRAQQTVIFLH